MDIKEFKVQYALGSLPFHQLAELARSQRTHPIILSRLRDGSDQVISRIARRNPCTNKNTMRYINRYSALVAQKGNNE